MKEVFILILSKPYKFQRTFFVIGLIAFINFSFPNRSFAKDVNYDNPIKFTLKNGGYWVLRVGLSEGTKTLEVFTDVSLAKNKQILSSDISECFFCRGDEDNCAEDGIDIIEIPRHTQPIIRAVCHVGAHSQRLMLFDPKQSRDKPVLERTGAYFLNSSQKDEGLFLSYDQYVEGSTCPDMTENVSGFCKTAEYWP